MALSGSVTSSAYDNRSIKFSWTATQSVANNTSTISWKLVGAGSASGYYKAGGFKVVIDGDTVYSKSTDYRIELYNGTTVASGTKTITHKSDGSRTFSVSIEAGIYYYAVNCSGSKTFTLDTIARASSITSASNVTLGNACSIKWTPASSSFKYKLKFKLGDWSKTTDYISPSTTSAYTYTGYTIPLTVANQITSATTGTMTVYLYTYNGSTQIGSTASKTFTVTVPSSVKPTMKTLSVAIVNDNSVINGWGLAVAGYTKVKVTATAEGSYGSTISSFSINGGYNKTVNGSSLSYTGGVITSSGNKVFDTNCTDSRSRDSSQAMSDTIVFYAYSKPSMSSFTVSRSSTNAKKMVVKANWSFSSVNGKNAATAKLYYKKTNTNNWTTYGTISKNTSTTLNVDFDETSSYNFRIIVTDSLDNTAQQDVLVSTVEVLLDFRSGGKGLGVGKIAESDSMEVAMDIKLMKSVYIYVDGSPVTLEDYIKSVVGT